MNVVTALWGCGPDARGSRAGRVRRLAHGSAMVALLAASSLAGSSCSGTLRENTSSSFLIMDELVGSSGAQPSEFGGVLSSDVLTFVKTSIDGEEVRVPTIFADNGRVQFSLGLKDPGTAEDVNTPSTTNFITVTRYRVEYVRSDGRNTPGVDVPYPFDGAITLTVGSTTVVGTLNLVRIQAKQEAPLKALAGGGGAVVISTIARVTFYGHDQNGRAVSVTGQIGVNFADWGDPS